jgi:hypothetical protein
MHVAGSQPNDLYKQILGENSKMLSLITCKGFVLL